MRRERRKNRFLRRIALGLAVAAVVAPAAQAKLDSGTGAQGSAAESAAVPRGEDHVIISTADDTEPAAAPRGEDHVIISTADDTEPAAAPRGEDHVVVSTADHTAPNPLQYTVAGYPLALQDDGTKAFIHGEDKVYYTVAGLPVGLQDDGTRTEAPVEAVRSPGSFDWGDALLGAGVAFGAMLLLGFGVLGTRHVRPAAA